VYASTFVTKCHQNRLQFEACMARCHPQLNAKQSHPCHVVCTIPSVPVACKLAQPRSAVHIQFIINKVLGMQKIGCQQDTVHTVYICARHQPYNQWSDSKRWQDVAAAPTSQHTHKPQQPVIYFGQKMRLSQKAGHTQRWHQIISTTSQHRTGSHSNKHITITKRKQCHKQPKTVVRNLRVRGKNTRQA
jgi:hypothetical protein